MSGITTHVLDTARGLPAVGLPVALESRAPSGGWARLGEGFTDAKGRHDLTPPGGLGAGVHRLLFDTQTYFAACGVPSFTPEICGRLYHRRHQRALPHPSTPQPIRLPHVSRELITMTINLGTTSTARPRCAWCGSRAKVRSTRSES